MPEKNLTFRDVFAQWVNALPRADKQNDPAALRTFLRERLGWPHSLPSLKAQRIGQEETGPWSAEFWLLETEPGIRLPAALIRKQDTRVSLPMTLPSPVLRTPSPLRGESAGVRGPSAGSEAQGMAPTAQGVLTLIPGRDKQAAARALEPGVPSSHSP